MLLLIRLGLRASEVAFLELDNIDWKSGRLLVNGKGGHPTELPLPTDVGEAIVEYLKLARPGSVSRRVFIRGRAPIRGFMTATAIGSIVKHAIERTGIDAPTKGTHQFRHALATEMLRSGASLTEIGEVLGHRSPETTKIYAKVDLDCVAFAGLVVAGRYAMNTLRKAAREYLTMRRNLGFKMHGADKPLLDFITFLEQRGAVYITQQLALTWAQQPSAARPAEWARRLRLVRGFALHRSATDPRTQVPPCGLLPHRPQRARPYLYTQEEIRRLLSAAREMTPGAGLRPWTYYCLFGLLSVSGLRIGEARNLELQDVDLKEALLTIRGAKFGKSRLVPLHASTCNVLADYIARRKRFLSGRQASPPVHFSPR